MGEADEARAGAEIRLDSPRERNVRGAFAVNDAYTTAQMSARTRSYWSTRTGVGAGFFTTAVLGIIVGFVVVGQILYSGTLQYIREYGTLKAMGARNSAVVRVILSQAMISARWAGTPLTL